MVAVLQWRGEWCGVASKMASTPDIGAGTPSKEQLHYRETLGTIS